MKNLLPIITLILSSNYVVSQTSKSIGEKDSLMRWYKYNPYIERGIYVDPIDGSIVKMIPYRVNDKYGFVSKKINRFIIKPKFNHVQAVYRKGAIVQEEKDGNFGVVNRRGEYIIKKEYKNLFKEGSLYHGLIEKYDSTLPEEFRLYFINRYFNRNGHFLFEQKSHDHQGFSDINSLAWFRYGKTISIRDRNGKLAKQFSDDKKKMFVGINNNLLLFEEKQGALFNYRAIDLAGNLIINLYLPIKAREIYKLSKNFYLVVSPTGGIFCDSASKIKPYLCYENFEFGHVKELYRVLDKETKLFGVVNRNAEIIVPIKYLNIYEYVNGLAACKTASHYINNVTTVQP